MLIKLPTTKRFRVQIFMDSLRIDYHIHFFSLQETPIQNKKQSSQGHKEKYARQ